MIQEQLPMELCELLQTLSLAGRHDQEVVNRPKESLVPNAQEDVAMFDDPSYQSDTAESDTSSISTRSESYGCAYLRALQTQLDSYSTTGGDYLEAIFTHREILSSYPAAHQDCARGFSDIAYKLEQREWRADREADTEAVAAFRHEAWTIAATITHYPIAAKAERSFASPVCVMQPAW